MAKCILIGSREETAEFLHSPKWERLSDKIMGSPYYESCFCFKNEKISKFPSLPCPIGSCEILCTPVVPTSLEGVDYVVFLNREESPESEELVGKRKDRGKFSLVMKL
ncbi:hypothetical protein A9K97_gp409 [Tokyovirus A1]|uniref:hypothetical protein n=1 Tax=Tokyovirus A1 TaxID=1826170 RepID=UPI0007A9600D|nr:hypothetical protein A9K97_gp409 [Tokyovirus A1]BAU79942.1 hypothetical protein [Tokyovirus A1]